MFIINTYVFSRGNRIMLLEDFEIYPTGSYLQFKSGIHRTPSVYGFTTGYVWYGLDRFASDAFETYSTGAVTANTPVFFGANSGIILSHGMIIDSGST